MKLGFIGAGNMAGGVISGIINTGSLKPADIAINDVLPEKRADYSAKGFVVYDDIGNLTNACDTIFLAVKPQNFAQVLAEIAPHMAPDKVLVSIGAGITAQSIKAAVGFDCKVVLAMPNMPLLLGYGAVAVARVEPTTEAEFAAVRALFDGAGITGEIAPDQMNQIIPVNGSGPAFVYQFARVMARCAEDNGIDGDVAMKLFCQTLIGSAHMLMESGLTASELIKEVSSPGGTTVAGMRALEEFGFNTAIEKAVEACANRAAELAIG